MIDAGALRALGPRGIFVNISRGWLVDEPALVEALMNGRQGDPMIALSTIDCALWDIKGKVLGQPIWRLLGGPTRTEVPAEVTVPGYSAFGQSTWRLADQATFVAALPCLRGAARERAASGVG